jgi:aspartyl/asparaginyl beta-hydroxylase
MPTIAPFGGGLFRNKTQSRSDFFHSARGRDVSTTLSQPLSGRAQFARMCKLTLRRVVAPVVIYGPVIYFFPKFALFLGVCGAYDVSRNTGLNMSMVRRYFLGNGVLLWLLSPLNVLLDIFSLPYINKGIYRLEDMPPGHQEEIKRLIKAATDADLVRQVEERSKENKRSMLLWRYYGLKSSTIVDVPAFEGPWKYIQTIGLSVFNKKISTSLHFGWVRASLRVLYNINDMNDKSAYITVGDTTHYWRDEKLFIFDDTLQHLSANETDRLRYCMYVDILRPSPFPGIMAAVCAFEGWVTTKIKAVSLTNWTLVQR